MFRRIRIGTKLAAALAVPLVALVAVAVVEVASSASAADDGRSQAELAKATAGPGSFVVNLQNERNRASIDLIGLGAATSLPVKAMPRRAPITADRRRAPDRAPGAGRRGLGCIRAGVGPRSRT